MICPGTSSVIFHTSGFPDNPRIERTSIFTESPTVSGPCLAVIIELRAPIQLAIESPSERAEKTCAGVAAIVTLTEPSGEKLLVILWKPHHAAPMRHTITSS